MKNLAIVTGASAGIGKATAEWFLRNNFDVICVARRPCPLAAVTSIECDLLSALPDDVQHQLIAAIEAAGETSIVHCAGQHNGDTALTLSRQKLTDALAINVTAPAMLNQSLLPVMKAGSSVIFVGSTLGDKAVAGAIGYVTSKHAVNGLMRATCQDLAGKQIHTAVVSPGFTDTEMLRAHLGDKPEVMASVLATVTQGRLIDVHEIAETIGFCATHPVINGSVIHANLGQVER
ncbi:MAG: SDR family NAD(P)-dependent oxidoreductase [Woeseiaceae bacterium]